MKSQRLTLRMKSGITRKLMDTVLVDETEKAAIQLEKTQRALFEASLGTFDIDSIPEGWLPRASTFSVFTKEGYRLWESMSNSIPMPDFLTHYQKTDQHKLFSSNSPVIKAVRAAEKKLAGIREQKQETVDKLSAALENFNTTKALVEGWPEIADSITDIIGSPKNNLPVVQNFTALNKSLGLKKGLKDVSK